MAGLVSELVPKTAKRALGSENSRAQKMVERMHLDLFIDAYADTAREELTVVRESERPDFICARADGEEVGLELVQAMREPEAAFWEEVVDGKDARDPGQASAAVFARIFEKADKLATGNWQSAANTILVVQAMDCPLPKLRWALEGDPPLEELQSTGFVEIWVADFSELDAYPRMVELFGLYPMKWWGHHERWRGKPYG